VIVHPRVLRNPPGLDAIAYRAGDFASFREALLRVREDERDLVSWRPSASGDLALQLVEWWAYLADILTFYSERIANDSYLRTARERATVARLTTLLGYRPRPSLGATGKLWVTIAGPGAITLPVGLPIQSKPLAGKPPEVFEADVATNVHPSTSIDVTLVKDVLLSQATTLFVKGGFQSFLVHYPVLFVKKGSTPGGPTTAVAIIKSGEGLFDAHGKKCLKLVFEAPIDLPPGAMASDYDLMTQVGTKGFPYPVKVTPDSVDSTRMDTGKPVEIFAGELVLFKPVNHPGPTLVTTVAAVIQIFLDPPPYFTQVFLPNAVPPALFAGKGPLMMSSSWRSVASVVCDPTTEVHLGSGATETERIVTVAPTKYCFPFPAAVGEDVMLQDAGGRAAIATVLSSEVESVAGLATSSLPGGYSVLLSTVSKVVLRFAAHTTVDLSAKLRLLFDLLPVSRGQTVASEVLGSGDAAQMSQTFALKKSPLTYLATSDPAKSGGYESTLRVAVDGVEWTEVDSFYEVAPDAQVFVTREDDEQKTHVFFGDGENGSRLPTGGANVVAAYRFGGGASAPAAGTLITPMKAYPGLKSVKNPLPAGGGADPDTARLIRRYAPLSALTLGRAISEDDHAAIAARAPGVTRARALFDWDTKLQQALVIVFVGNDELAVAAALAALAATVDPDRPFVVRQAVEITCDLSMRLLVDPRHDAAAVRAAVEQSLVDPDVGLFRPEITRIGGAFYDSWIHEACSRVAGVVAVHDLGLSHGGSTPHGRHSPGIKGYFALAQQSINIKTEVAINVD
jgi:hypothetical protein